MINQLPNTPIRALVLDDSPDSSDLVANLLRAEAGFAVTASPLAFGEGVRVARKSEPDVIVLVADSLVGTDAHLAVEELEGAAPTSAIVVLTSGDAARVREFTLAGARDCLAPPYNRDALVASVRKVYLNESRRRERLAANFSAGQRRHRCQVIAIHGAKGGVGTTSVAVNVAVGLRKLTNERVAVVDASLQAGDVGVSLNLTSASGIDDLLPHLNDLDVDLMNRVLAVHPSGVKALLAPKDLERAEAVAGDEIRRILAFLAGHFDYIIVDTAPALDAAGLAALDHSDQIILLTTPDIAALRNAGRFLQLARRLGYPSEKVALVVNRATSHHAIQIPEIEKRLGMKPVATIPSHDRAALGAASLGTVLADNASFRSPGRHHVNLAHFLVVRSSVPVRRGLFGGFPKLTIALPGRTGGKPNATKPPVLNPKGQPN